MAFNANFLIKNVCFLRSVGVDDSVAFDQALTACCKTEAKLTIVSVVDEVPDGLLEILASWCSPSQLASSDQAETLACEELAESARSRGIETAVRILRGNRFLEVTKETLRQRYDLLIKTPEPSLGLQQVLVGHIDRQLIRKCPCTIWLVKPARHRWQSRVVAAVDPALFREGLSFVAEREELNQAILDCAQTVATIKDAELHAVHVWSFDVESTLRHRVGLDEVAISEAGNAIRRRHELAVAKLIAAHGSEVLQIHLPKGLSAGREIAQLIEKESIDVVVMGTMCRTGIGGFLIGNTAESTLDQANCSIVALKPAGFVSPVQL